MTNNQFLNTNITLQPKSNASVTSEPGSLKYYDDMRKMGKKDFDKEMIKRVKKQLKYGSDKRVSDIS